MSIFSAPYFALFSKDFYKWVAVAPLRKAFQYLLYLSCLMVLVSMLLIFQKGFPRLDQFVAWLQAELPNLTLTSDGLTMDLQSPYTIIHPEFGPLIRFDMSFQEAKSDSWHDVFVLVTSQNLYVRQQDRDVRVYHFFDPQQVPSLGTTLMTPEVVGNIYQRTKPWLAALAVVVTFLFFLIWKVLAALFYSWLGLLLNMARQEKLTFSAVYRISVFAMTASILFQWLRLLVPILNFQGLSGLLDLLLTTAYLYIGIKKTEDSSTAAVG